MSMQILQPNNNARNIICDACVKWKKRKEIHRTDRIDTQTDKGLLDRDGF